MNPSDSTTSATNAERPSKYQLGDRVERKFFGRGRIDQVRPTTSGHMYHVRFEHIELWVPEGDLKAAPAKAENATTATP